MVKVFFIVVLVFLFCWLLIIYIIIVDIINWYDLIFYVLLIVFFFIIVISLLVNLFMYVFLKLDFKFVIWICFCRGVCINKGFIICNFLLVFLIVVGIGGKYENRLIVLLVKIEYNLLKENLGFMGNLF